MRFFLPLLALALAACSTDEHAAGTTNPAVTTPAEAPVSAGDTPPPPAPDSTGDAR